MNCFSSRHPWLGKCFTILDKANMSFSIGEKILPNHHFARLMAAEILGPRALYNWCKNIYKSQIMACGALCSTVEGCKEMYWHPCSRAQSGNGIKLYLWHALQPTMEPQYGSLPLSTVELHAQTFLSLPEKCFCGFRPSRSWRRRRRLISFRSFCRFVRSFFPVFRF